MNTSLLRVVTWVMLYPLQSVRRLLQICSQDAAHLDLHNERDEKTRVAELIQWISFRQSSRMGQGRATGQSFVTVFVLPPSTFSNEDLGAFTEACPIVS